MTKALEKAHQVKAVRFLYGCDHAFLSKEQVHKLTKPFGFVGHTYLAKANPQDFKGLSLWNDKGEPVDEMEGQDADIVATQIARHLGVKYTPMLGRGSQLAECCARTLEYLENKKATSPEIA